MKKIFLLLISFLIISLFVNSCTDETPLTSDNESLLKDKYPGKDLPADLVISEETSSNKAKILNKTNQLVLWESDFGTGLNQSDDDCDYISFGFTFNFYGNNYSGAWVNSNGNVTFNDCNTAWSHPDIPDGANSVIGTLYGDFNPSAGGDVYVNHLGTGRTERVVITWANVPEWSPGGGSNSFQLHLFKKKSVIVFGYNGLTTDGINWAYAAPSTDGNMDVGISSGTGAFINSATGTEIPGLDWTNIVYYQTRRHGYVEIMAATPSQLQGLGIF